MTEAAAHASNGLESVKKSQQVAPLEPATPAHTLPSGPFQLTIAQGMKRLAILAAALFAAGLIGMLATSLLIDATAVRLSVEQQLRAATGLDLEVNGSVQVSVFPGSQVTLRDVGLRGAGTKQDAPLSVDELTAHLSLLPLLIHTFKIADVVLTNPRINVTHDAQGQSNWAPIAETLARSIKPGAKSQVSFSEIRVIDGVVTYRNAAGETTDTIGDIDLSLGWPSISQSFAATGQFDWRGQRIDGSLLIGDFVAALSGEKSVLKIRATSAPLKFAFDGTMANRTSLLMEGAVSADSSALRDVVRWAGQNVPSGSGLGRFALKARANVVGESVALTNVNVELDGNAAEGVISYTRGDRQIVQATLASEALDLTPYTNTVRLLVGGARDWNRQPFDLGGFSVTDVDMRLSAAKATIGPTKIGRTAIGANLRNGALTFTVGEAQIHGGMLKGSLSVTKEDAAANVKTQLQFTDIDLASSASEMFGVRNLSGRGSINVMLEAKGANVYALTQTLNGTASLIGRDGAITGFNVEQLLKRLERRPLSGAGNFRSGNTPFNTLNVAVRVNNGIASTDDAAVEGPTAKLTLSGTASVPAREYDLKGVASLISAPDTPPSFQLPFVIQGPWDDPLVLPDSEALIRRSPASAPLLDSLRDRKTRDAVQSVIDRLTGGKKTPAAEPPTTVGSPAADAPAPLTEAPAAADAPSEKPN